jgi:hypothetical protein
VSNSPSSKAPCGKPSKQRDAARRRARAKRLKAERRAALTDPDRADVRPVAVSVREFMKASGLSAATINRRIRDGSLRSSKRAGRRLISFDEIVRLRHGD